MILTAQEEFGLRCALTVARAGERDDGTTVSVTLGHIAECEGLTVAYAGKIMRLLVQGEVVESTRGRSGGYRLARSADQVQVRDVVQVLGGKFYDGEICSQTVSRKGLCVHNNDCAVRSLWSGLQTMIDVFLDRITLRDLVVDEATMTRSVASIGEGIAAATAAEIGARALAQEKRR